jgi:hypothetical protein
MLNLLNREKHKGLIVLLTLVMGWMFWAPVDAWGTEEGLGENMAVVVGKAPNCLFLSPHRLPINGNYLMVAPNATFVDKNDKRISLKKLKVPCTVSIKMRRKSSESDPELVRLKVKEYLKDAKQRFTRRQPYERRPH